MKTILLLLILITTLFYIQAQTSPSNMYANSAERLLKTDGNLSIGGYAEVHYNQELDSEVKNNGKLDVHRVVMLFGYQFNEKVQFISELEYEHVKEVYVEQAFVQYKFNNALSLRAGLLLTPMGIINEYHEPNTFNGVERPIVDKLIAPTTWREIGVGLSGIVTPLNLRYRGYILNGFNGYDENGGKLRGKNGLRKGRQKGAESYISSPNIGAKIEYFGIKGLNIGLSAYFGKSQSTLFDGIKKDDKGTIAKADSSVVSISMIGADFRYSNSGFQFKGQWYYNSLGNTNKYNLFTAKGGKSNDLGKSMVGYYLEAGYNVFNHADKIKSELTPFARFESYDTQNTLERGIIRNKSYAANVITAGLTWKVTPKVAFKTDMQFINTGADDKTQQTFNAGFGLMF